MRLLGKGFDSHVHFLIQSLPLYSAKKIVQLIKSITAREILAACPGVKKKLWDGEFRSDEYFISTVGQHRKCDQGVD